MFSVLTNSTSGATVYRDDRSSAAELVRSLYNAINRHEYGRAYDYFMTPPAKDYPIYEAGFAKTERVDVLIGNVSAKGAAGKTYYTVPAAIRSVDTKGDKTHFAGCYIVVALNLGVQGSPFRPMQIDKGNLKPVNEGDYSTSAIPNCGTKAEPDDNQPSVEKVKALFVIEQQDHCDKVEDTRGGLNEPHAYQFKYHLKGAPASDPDAVTTVFAFECSQFAYNDSQVYYAHDNVFGLRLISFAEPHLAITHPPGDEESKILKSLAVDGYTSSIELINSEVDVKAGTITAFNKWRGIADASSNGTWTFKQGEFILTDFDADPTYNGEMDSISVLKNGKQQKLP